MPVARHDGLNARLTTALRFTALALLAALAFLIVCQLAVATWLARENTWREALWARGETHWRWDFSQASNIVGKGSSGLANASFKQDGLHAIAPEDGAIGLSLALRGERIDVPAIGQVTLTLETSGAARVVLLVQRGATQPVWVETRIEAGSHELELTPAPTGDAPTESLQLQIYTTAGGRVVLHRLALHPVSHAPPKTIEATDAPTPERLLAFRDHVRLQSPSAPVIAPAPWQWPAQTLARGLPSASWLPWFSLVAALIAVAFALHRRLHAAEASSPRRAMLELCVALLPCAVLLLAGWPAREANFVAMLAFVCAGVSLFLWPVPQPTWRWFGNAIAWRDAMLATILIALLLTPLSWLPDAAATPSRSPERFWRYPLWALLQQAMLLIAIAPRCLLIARSHAPNAALLAGLAFALLHLPNFALMLATAAGGTLWAMLGFRHRALLPLATSHAILGLWLTHIAPAWLLRSAEVGGRFLMGE